MVSERHASAASGRNSIRSSTPAASAASRAPASSADLASPAPHRVGGVDVARGAVQVERDGAAARRHLARQHAGEAGAELRAAAVVRRVAGEVDERAEQPPVRRTHAEHRHLRVDRALHVERHRVVEGAVRAGRAVAHDDAAVVAHLELEARAEADLGVLHVADGAADEGDDLVDQRAQVALVAAHVAAVGHRRAGVVVRGADHDVGAREAVLRLAAAADLVHRRPAHAQRVEHDERDALARVLEDGRPRVQRIEHAGGDDLPQHPDLLRADGRRDVHLGETCPQGHRLHLIAPVFGSPSTRLLIGASAPPPGRA